MFGLIKRCSLIKIIPLKSKMVIGLHFVIQTRALKQYNYNQMYPISYDSYKTSEMEIYCTYIIFHFLESYLGVENSKVVNKKNVITLCQLIRYQ